MTGDTPDVILRVAGLSKSFKDVKAVDGGRVN
jgi:hypothetical protein